jgi:uncharacterized membrane protein
VDLKGDRNAARRGAASDTVGMEFAAACLTVADRRTNERSLRMTRIVGPAAALTLLLAACGGGEGNEADSALAPANPEAPSGSAAPGADEAARASWGLSSSGEGVALVYPAAGDAAVRLSCPAGGRALLVNIPAFRPVASEERLSFGSGGEVVALVADAGGDPQRGGVSGTGPVPANLQALVSGPIAVNYGSQNGGPYPALPRELGRSFVAACRQGAATPRREGSPPGPAHPCLVQAGERLRNPPLRVVGTEPFWGARIEGRCVTYSHPEDQDGTRIWTRHSAGPSGGGTWSGELGKRRFELVVRPHPGCSDGMSDRRYPFAAELTVNGERRLGCALAAGGGMTESPKSIFNSVGID